MVTPMVQEALIHLAHLFGTQGVYVSGKQIYSATFCDIPPADIQAMELDIAPEHLTEIVPDDPEELIKFFSDLRARDFEPHVNSTELIKFLSDLEAGQLSGTHTRAEPETHDKVTEDSDMTMMILSMIGVLWGAAFCFVQGETLQAISCAEEPWSKKGAHPGVKDILETQFSSSFSQTFGHSLEAGELEGAGYFEFLFPGILEFPFPGLIDRSVLDIEFTEFSRRAPARETIGKLQLSPHLCHLLNSNGIVCVYDLATLSGPEILSKLGQELKYHKRPSVRALDELVHTLVALGLMPESEYRNSPDPSRKEQLATLQRIFDQFPGIKGWQRPSS